MTVDHFGVKLKDTGILTENLVIPDNDTLRKNAMNQTYLHPQLYEVIAKNADFCQYLKSVAEN